MNRSKVWKHFTKKNKNEAECVICSKVLKYANGSTSTLSHHLKAVHAEAETSDEAPNMKRQKASHDFVKNKSVEDVAKLAGVDGLSYRLPELLILFYEESFKNVQLR